MVVLSGTSHKVGDPFLPQAVVVQLPLFVGEKLVDHFKNLIFPLIPLKLLSVCAESQLDSLSMNIPLYRAEHVNLKFLFCFYTL